LGTLASRLRLSVITIVALGGLAALVVGSSSTAGAATDPCARNGCVDVVAVNGLIDQIEADFIISTLEGARKADGVVAVVLQFDSGGTAVGDDRLDDVATAITNADVPVSVWIGPSGSEALGGAVELVQVADSSGIAPGSKIGDAGPQRLSVAQFGELLTGKAAVARTQVLSGQEAVKAGVVTRFSPTVGDHLVNLEGVKTRTTTEDGQRRQVPLTTVRFSKLPLFTQLFHTVASPSVAYLLLTVGLGLLLFEFFTAGVGIAGVVGAVCTILAGYGVAELPHNQWALLLVIASFVAFGIDVQTGIPRAWTIIGMAMFAVGSLFLFTDFRATWIALAAGLIGIAVTMFSGMPAMVRTRFATPTIGREWMVGELGDAASGVDPEGTVQVRGALWRARSNRATPIAAGERIRVVAIDGLVLEVEPEEGGAIDYREMRNRRKGAAVPAAADADAADDGEAPPPADA
jgi:membrane-bound serine protease (ClpP class)